MKVFEKIFRPDGRGKLRDHPWYCFDIVAFLAEMKLWFGDGGCHPIDQASGDWKKLVSTPEVRLPQLSLGARARTVEIQPSLERFINGQILTPRAVVSQQHMTGPRGHGSAFSDLP